MWRGPTRTNMEIFGDIGLPPPGVIGPRDGILVIEFERLGILGMTRLVRSVRRLKKILLGLALQWDESSSSSFCWCRCRDSASTTTCKQCKQSVYITYIAQRRDHFCTRSSLLVHLLRRYLTWRTLNQPFYRSVTQIFGGLPPLP